VKKKVQGKRSSSEKGHKKNKNWKFHFLKFNHMNASGNMSRTTVSKTARQTELKILRYAQFSVCLEAANPFSPYFQDLNAPFGF
jgi:hypothetical protein